MNILSLLSNGAAVLRYVKLVTMLPTLLAFVQAFESANVPGAEKKKQVLKALDLTTNILEKRGFLSAELNTELDVLASEVIDAIVEVFNAVGVFRRGAPAAVAHPAAHPIPAAVVVNILPPAAE